MEDSRYTAYCDSDAEIIEKIGQEWCLCPFEWGLEDKVTVQSSQGKLILCAVGRVVSGKNKGKINYEPLSRSSLHII